MRAVFRCGATPRMVAPAFLMMSLILSPADTPAASTITKPTFSGGAVGSSGGSFRLGATIGEAGVVGRVSGGSHELIEGFWQPNMGIATSVETPPSEPSLAPAYTKRLCRERAEPFP